MAGEGNGSCAFSVRCFRERLGFLDLTRHNVGCIATIEQFTVCKSRHYVTCRPATPKFSGFSLPSVSPPDQAGGPFQIK